MSKDILRYDKIVEDALRGVVRTALNQVAEHGLPANHSLYITFRTTAPGVEIDDSLHQEYPEEMTIVLQHQYWDLDIHSDRFAVTLSFNKVQHRLLVPLAAVTAFADPAVNFGLRFEVGEAATDEAAATSRSDAESERESEAGPPPGEVVNLDAFRKK